MATLLQTTITGGDGTGSSTDNYLGLTNHNNEPGTPAGKLYANTTKSSTCVFPIMDKSNTIFLSSFFSTRVRR